ncbi:MAG: serine protease, partial [bacterium]|nr:serine protease [bacterium]
IYWFYRQWKSLNEENKLKHGGFTLWMLALFSPLTSYSLFKHVSGDVKEVNDGKGLESGTLAVVYFFLTRFWLGFLPLIPVQNKINLYWEKKYKDKLVRSNFGIWNWIIVIAVAVIMLLAFYSEDTTTDTSSVIPETAVVEKDSREEIASSVVNIFCPSISTARNESSSGGSGIMLTKDGIVLTNSHIIPQNKTNILVDETGCLVVLPDSITGQPSEIYLAHPIVIPGISDDYDLAYMQIYDAFYDEETGEYKGTYPKKFPAFDDTNRCNNEDIKLGEPVRIYGYPAISGGYSLTVTDGVVSSFPGEGLIVTSAKISYGNSGGLAVDKDGCMIGVPSLVSSDDRESLGVIYSMDLVDKFSEEVKTYLDNLDNQ